MKRLNDTRELRKIFKTVKTTTTSVPLKLIVVSQDVQTGIIVI